MASEPEPGAPYFAWLPLPKRVDALMLDVKSPILLRRSGYCNASLDKESIRSIANNNLEGVHGVSFGAYPFDDHCLLLYTIELGPLGKRKEIELEIQQCTSIREAIGFYQECVLSWGHHPNEYCRPRFETAIGEVCLSLGGAMLWLRDSLFICIQHGLYSDSEVLHIERFAKALDNHFQASSSMVDNRSISRATLVPSTPMPFIVSAGETVVLNLLNVEDVYPSRAVKVGDCKILRKENGRAKDRYEFYTYRPGSTFVELQVIHNKSFTIKRIRVPIEAQ